MLKHMPEHIQQRFKPLVKCGEIKPIALQIFPEEIRDVQMVTYNRSPSWYDRQSIMPSWSGMLANTLRKRIKDKYPEWCEVRTTPSKAFSTWWKKGNIYYMLIKRRYRKLPY